MSQPVTGMPIRTRVLLVSLAVAVLPLAIMFVFTQTVTRRALVAGEYGRMQELSDEVAREITHLMWHAKADVSVLSANPVLTAPGARVESRAKELQKIHDFYNIFSDITLYSTSGDVEVSTTYSYWESVEKTDWFKKALRGESSMSPPGGVVGMTGIYVTIYAPVRSEDGLIPNVISARVSFQRVWDITDHVRVGRRGFFALLDPHGNLLAYPDRARIFSRFDTSRPVSFWSNRVRGVGVSPEGKRYVFAARVMTAEETHTGQSWTLLAIMPYSEMLTMLRTENMVYLGVAALALALVYLTGIFLSRRMSGPIVEASAAAQRVSRGDLTAIVPESGPWEIQQMAQAFNSMVREVRDHRDRLEGLVEQRTAKLRESQDQIEEITAHLRAAYESIIDGILMVEWPSDRIMTANQRFAGFFGVAPEELLGKTCDDLGKMISSRFLEPRDQAFRCAHFQQHPEEVGLEEWELAKPRRMTLSVYSAPVTGLKGKVFARLWMFRDLTQQRQLEDELRQAQKMEAIGRLAGGIAHDFNNLLTGILGNISMAEMEVPKNSEASTYIGLAKQAGRRAGELVTQLLGFSRRSRLQLKKTDPNGLLHEVSELLRHTIDPRVELRLEQQQDLWLATVDPTQLQQVLMNLCVNAVDAMPGGGRLTLTSQNVHVDKDEAKQWLDARAGDYVRLSVEDMGHGMTQEVQGHLFEPFFTTKEPGKGTGLGLAMSYGIVKQHGGWITCYSEINRGTTFGIYLPRARASSEETHATVKELPVRGGSETILIVDDEAAVRGVIQSILRRYGYKSLLAANGEEALQILTTHHDRPDLILLDLTMPKLSGRDTFTGIRRITSDVPVVISSGYPVDVAAFEQEMGYKIHGFIQKPYEAVSIARTVREVLDAVKPPTVS